MKTSKIKTCLLLLGAGLLLVPAAEAGLGSVLARARNRIVRFPILDKILVPDPGPLQSAAVAPPEVPTRLRVDGRDGVLLRLAWDAPAAAPGRTIVRYNLRRNGVEIARPAGLAATVTINPTGAALESFTVAAIDDRGIESAASAPVVALRGAPVPFVLERRLAYAWVEDLAGAESALAEATTHLGELEWGGAFGTGGDGNFIWSPLGTALAARLHNADGGEYGEQVLSQSEYRFRVGAMSALAPGPGLPFGSVGPQGDPNGELPVGATVPIRWAEVLQPFDGDETQVLGVHQEDLPIGPDGVVSPTYFVSAPARAGIVSLRLLPNPGDLALRPGSGGDPAVSAPGVLVPGQATGWELMNPAGTDYFSAPAGLDLVATVDGPPGIVRLLAIDPERERAQGWDAAVADGIEIPPGTPLAGYVAPDGRAVSRRRLVVVGLSPGVVRVSVGVANAPATADVRTITVLPRIELAVDANRDGVVSLAAESAADRVTMDEPYRFWVNDDDDSGDTKGDDIPRGDIFTANFRDEEINGARDLGDFFPVYLDLGGALAVLRDGPPVQVRLRQADDAVNFAYTAADRANAEAHWRALPTTGFGDAFDRAPGAAQTHQVTAEGVLLSAAFLDGVRDRGQGVLLVEGRAPSRAPLVLEVEREGQVIAAARLGLRLGNVEEMFRRVDLTAVPQEYGETSAPPENKIPAPPPEPEAWPDQLTNGSYFVFVHGFNVDTQHARGWQAEMFKRLHVLGSRARFVGVGWNGATGLHVGEEYLDYHKAVFNALQTGDALAKALEFTAGAPVTVAAHSLGNGVVAQAIQFRDFRPQHYLMINPALPVEAFSPGDVTDDERANMVEHQWRDYAPRLQAGNWFQLFAAGDTRRELTWEGRYAGVLGRTDVHLFYSSGEDVLANSPEIESASVVAMLFRQGPMGQGSWKVQELAKGVDWLRSLGTIVLARGQAGWSFSSDWDVSATGGPNTGVNPRLRTPGETEMIGNDQLQTVPFFGRFLDKDLLSPEAGVASAKAKNPLVIYDLLARAIPAKSYAAAANPLKIKGFDNVDMPADVRLLPTDNLRWKHSDFKAIALPYVSSIYDQFVAKGALR